MSRGAIKGIFSRKEATNCAGPDARRLTEHADSPAAKKIENAHLGHGWRRGVQNPTNVPRSCSSHNKSAFDSRGIRLVHGVLRNPLALTAWDFGPGDFVRHAW